MGKTDFKLKFRIIQADGYTYQVERSLDAFYAWKERVAKGKDTDTWTPIAEKGDA